MNSKKPNRGTFKYKQDVQKLIRLKVKDRKQYKLSFKKLCKAYGISQQTLYRDMNKQNPGMRKRRKDSGKEKVKVTAKQKKIITENLLAGRTKKTAIKEAIKKTGKHISKDKGVKVKPVDKIENSNYGSQALKLIRKIFEIDFIAPDSGVSIKLKGAKRFRIFKQELEDMALIVAAAYDSVNDKKRFFVDKERLMDDQLFYLVQEEIRIAKAGSDIKRVESLVRMRNSLKSKELSNLIPDFYIAERAMKMIKPELTRKECIDLIKEAGKKITMNDG